jgi:hypothetical protein
VQGHIIQLDLPAWDERALSECLRELCAARIDLCLTDNGSTMMSFRPGTLRRPAQLRVHRMFAGAPPEVVEALAHWAMGRRRRAVCQLLDDFIAANHHQVRRRPVAVEKLETVGAHHDLQAYYDVVNVTQFAGDIDAPITWGRLPSLRRRRSIRLGSYTPDDPLIRIHPHLDQDFVPDFFVRYIVFHEMLHAQLGVEAAPSGRRCIHTREFNRRERDYPEYARAIAWHDDPANLRRLLRPAATSA